MTVISQETYSLWEDLSKPWRNHPRNLYGPARQPLDLLDQFIAKLQPLDLLDQFIAKLIHGLTN